MNEIHNPYGKRPGGGITLPEYYRPTPGCSSNNFFPPNELLPEGEMRICFTGSTPWPPTLQQSGTSIVLELGNGTPFPRRLFFDFGNGCVKNIIQLGILPPLVRDIFISHLHVDHYADLPYFMPFRAWGGGWRNGLRIFGPTGDRPETGTQYMVDKMHEMMTWHLENFDHCPIGAGYDTEVVEFDYKDEGGIVLEEPGLKVTHWARSHVKNGASAYRVDWEEAGLSFVWTGDGRPDESTIKFAKGCDIFVTEGQADVPQLFNYKYGTPTEVLQFTIDTYHTPYYAAGYLMNEIQPRAGVICHYTENPEGESIQEIRAHWDGLFMWGGPDIKVINVTKDRIWERMALRPETPAMQPPDPRTLPIEALPGGKLPDFLQMPKPRRPREEQQDAFLRERELDPTLYTPEDVQRPLTQHYDEEFFRIDIQALIDARDGK
jgi:ribonuclease Z